MNNQQAIIEVSEDTFQQKVLDVPEQITILVDFWAPWCAPCRMLTPILEDVVASYQGRVRLAKVNVDENPGLSNQYGVQGIPAVKIFQGGQIVQEFTGALPDHEIRRILDSVVSTEADEYVKKARDLIDKNKQDEAQVLLEQALEQAPKHSLARIELAKIKMEQKSCQEAKELLTKIDITDKGYAEAEGLLNRIDFIQKCHEHGGLEQQKLLVQNEPDNVDALYDLAGCLAGEGRYQDALETYLAVLKKDKKFRGGVVKDAMVRVFSIIGQRSAMADEYRDKLEWILY